MTAGMALARPDLSGALDCTRDKWSHPRRITSYSHRLHVEPPPASLSRQAESVTCSCSSSLLHRLASSDGPIKSGNLMIHHAQCVDPSTVGSAMCRLVRKCFDASASNASFNGAGMLSNSRDSAEHGSATNRGPGASNSEKSC